MEDWGNTENVREAAYFQEQILTLRLASGHSSWMTGEVQKKLHLMGAHSNGRFKFHALNGRPCFSRKMSDDVASC